MVDEYNEKKLQDIMHQKKGKIQITQYVEDWSACAERAKHWWAESLALPAG